jgi:DNA-binding response OmpR family regulator
MASPSAGLRGAKDDIAIIMLTAKATISDHIVGLENGRR